MNLKVNFLTENAILTISAPNRRLSISVFPKKAKAYVGEKVVFRCASSGESDPILRWNVRNSYRVHATDGLLTFESVTIENNGLYVCTASNRYGTVSTKVKLHVTGSKYGSFDFYVCCIKCIEYCGILQILMLIHGY